MAAAVAHQVVACARAEAADDGVIQLERAADTAIKIDRQLQLIHQRGEDLRGLDQLVGFVRFHMNLRLD